jgi:phenylacetic acid degradation protein
MIYEFEGIKPVVHPSAFVHPLATVTGNVIIGRDVYIGPGAAIRGDFGQIVIEDGCNVQENCTVHMFPGVTVYLREGSHVGHGAIVHAVVMDNAVIGDNSIVGALSFVPAGMIVEERKVVAGNPAKVIKDASDEMIAWKTEGTTIYRKLPEACHRSLIPCEPLTELPEGRTSGSSDYKPWKST